MILLAATIAVAGVDLGAWNAPAALSIAAAKGLLVMVYLMHLRAASNIVRLFAAAGFFWFAILVALSLSDYLTRGG
jgi:cytochrome c oxidase subunit 4